jgi:nitroreductase/NAD-dependent dihydropyrimidine dehydrogenase PreA subunit
MKINRTVTTVIDPDLCNGCGLCITVCPKETIALVNGKAVITGPESMNCGHCAAVCPTGAVSVSGINPSLSEFATFQVVAKWLPYGKIDTGTLVNLMQSRRSCRNFRDEAVRKDMLEDLVKIGATAPSGSNCQMWTFTILPDRKSLDTLGKKVGKFYQNLNRLAEKSWLRFGMKLFGKPELERYYQNYYESVKEGLEEREKNGRDLLFHGATAAIVVGSKNEASCPSEDALLATQNILLAAHSMGLGTCLIGFVIEAMKRDKTINRSLGIPDDETPYVVIALGYPNEKYQRIAGRKQAAMRYVENQTA